MESSDIYIQPGAKSTMSDGNKVPEAYNQNAVAFYEGKIDKLQKNVKLSQNKHKEQISTLKSQIETFISKNYELQLQLTDEKGKSQNLEQKITILNSQSQQYKARILNLQKELKTQLNVKQLSRNSSENDQKIESLEKKNKELIKEVENAMQKWSEKCHSYDQLKLKHDTFTKFSLQRSSKYEQKLIQQRNRLKEADMLLQKMNQIKSNLDEMSKQYFRINRRNNELMDLKEQRQRMERKRKQYESMIGLIGFQNNIRNKYQVQRQEHNLPEDPQLQFELNYLKVMIKAGCLELDKLITDSSDSNKIGSGIKRITSLFRRHIE